jgi:hypothetical protein
LQKLIAYITLCCLFIVLASFTSLPISDTKTSYSKSEYAITATKNASYLYIILGLESIGLSKQAFDYAYKGYQHLMRKKMITDLNYLTICEFSQPSNKKRLYVIDLASNEVVINTYVAHGRNSGFDYATRFSNKPESLQSSLGFYVTGHTYTGENGFSLRMQGLERGFNDKAYERAIVIHGAEYIGSERLRASSCMGRSFGCPAVPAGENAALINTIKNGTCLFVYHPSKNYLKGSKILNG